MKRLLSSTGILFIFFAVSCSSLNIKNEATLQVASREAMAGNEAAFIAMEEALENEAPEEAPDIHEQILRELASLPNEKSIKILRKYMSDRIPGRRGQAVLSFSRNRQLSSKEREKELIQTVRSNKNTYSEILPAEVQALGNVVSEESLEILKSEFVGNSNRDLIVQSTGFILSRSNTASDERVSQLATQNLLFYVENTSNPDLQRLSIQTLTSAGGNLAMLKALTLNADAEYSVRSPVLAFLARDLQENKDSQYEKNLARAWTSFRKTEKIYAREIVEALAAIKGLSPEKMLAILKRSLRPAAPPLRRKYLAMGTPDGIIRLGATRGVPRSVFSKIDRGIKIVMRDEKIPVTPEKRILSAAFNSMKPGASYFEKKDMGSNGISQRRAFSSIMSLLVRSKRSVAWQLMVLRNLAGLSQNEALQIRKFYLSEKTTLDRL